MRFTLITILFLFSVLVSGQEVLESSYQVESQLEVTDTGRAAGMESAMLHIEKGTLLLYCSSSMMFGSPITTVDEQIERQFGFQYIFQTCFDSVVRDSDFSEAHNERIVAHLISEYGESVTLLLRDDIY